MFCSFYGPCAIAVHARLLFLPPTTMCCTCVHIMLQVRMQSEGKLAPGVPKKYTSAVGAYGVIVR